MIISYEWLKSFLPGLTLSPQSVADELTRHSFETIVVGKRTLDPQVRVVKITQLDPHPQADRLRLASVSDGETTVQVVCGAPNIAAGEVVPFSPPGTTLFNATGEQFTLKPAKIRGVDSPGMLNSLRELGLGAAQAGLFVLPPDTPLGSKLIDFIPNDTLLEADITRNRAPDCLSLRGVARELGAIVQLPVQAVALAALPQPAGDWQVSIMAKDEVVRYLGLYGEGVRVRPSPLWLQARLLSAGIRPINNVVDITNYVMLELGNPVHAFDADKLPSTVMGVRFAHDTEELITLDGKKRFLASTDLVITSGEQSVALAGIMGGAAGEVTQPTARLLIEIANFTPYIIQQTAQRLAVRTEAAARFIKGIDPTLVAEAAQRVAALLTEHASAQLVAGVDYYPIPVSAPVVRFRPSRVATLAGVDVAVEGARDTLTAQRFTVEEKQPDLWEVTPPTARLDITGEHDVVEEVIRLAGLETIPAPAPLLPAQGSVLPAPVAWREAIRDMLVRWGVTETYNYSFAPGGLAQQLGEIEKYAIAISNPIAPELTYLRQSLLPGLLQNIYKNKGEFRMQKIFEIGTVFSHGSGGAVPGVREKVLLAGAVVGGEKDSDALVEIIIVDRLLAELGITDITKRREINKPLGEHTVLIHRRKQLGRFGILAPEIGGALKFESPIAVFEIDLGALIGLTTNNPPPYQVPRDVSQYQPFSKYPPVWRDVSVVVDSAVRIEDIQQIIERAGGEVVVDVDLFDVYVPSRDEAAEKSVAFHIKYQSSKKTLTDDEVAACHNQVVAALKKELAATIRD